MRGGGLYACGFAVTFIWLEAGSIIDDIRDVGLLFDGQIVTFFLNFIIDSLQNTLSAFLWPVSVLKSAAPWGAIGLGIAFWLFPIHVKPRIESWLFSGDEDVSDDEGREEDN